MSPTKRAAVPPDPKVGERLDLLLKLHRMKQHELASRVSVTPSAVSQWIKGTSAITAVNARRIAEVLGEDVDFIMGRVDKGTKGFGGLLASLERIMGADLARRLLPLVDENPEAIRAALEAAAEQIESESDGNSGS